MDKVFLGYVISALTNPNCRIEKIDLDIWQYRVFNDSIFYSAFLSHNHYLYLLNHCDEGIRQGLINVV